jgi:ribosomal-protein-alanine N-acetyltransferase
MGLSKLLLDDFIKFCKFNGIEKIFLEVKDSNKVAIALYENFGFKKISQRKNYYSDGSNADIMILEI